MTILGVWPLNENAEDLSGNGNDGIISGATLNTTTQKLGDGCRDFDSIDDKITVLDDDIFTFGNGSTDSPFSLNFWMYRTSANAVQFLVQKDTSGTIREWTSLTVNGNIQFMVTSSDVTKSLAIRTTAAPSANAWHMITLTYDGSSVIGGLTIYVDKVSQAVTNVSIGVYVAMSNTSADVVIGARSTGANAFGGRLDEISIDDIEFTQAQVDVLWNGGAGIERVGAIDVSTTVNTQTATFSLPSPTISTTRRNVFVPRSIQDDSVPKRVRINDTPKVAKIIHIPKRGRVK